MAERRVGLFDPDGELVSVIVVADGSDWEAPEGHSIRSLSAAEDRAWGRRGEAAVDRRADLARKLRDGGDRVPIAVVREALLLLLGEE